MNNKLESFIQLRQKSPDCKFNSDHMLIEVHNITIKYLKSNANNDNDNDNDNKKMDRISEL